MMNSTLALGLSMLMVADAAFTPLGRELTGCSTVDSDDDIEDQRPRGRVTDGLVSGHQCLTHHVEQHAIRNFKEAHSLQNQRLIITMLRDVSNMLRANPALASSMSAPVALPATQFDEHAGDIVLSQFGDADQIVSSIRHEPHHCQLATVAVLAAWLIGRQCFWNICQSWAYWKTNMDCGFPNNTDAATSFSRFYYELTFTLMGSRMSNGWSLIETPEIDALNLRFNDSTYRDCWNKNYQVNGAQGITTELLNVMGLIAVWIWIVATIVRLYDVKILPN